MSSAWWGCTPIDEIHSKLALRIYTSALSRLLLTLKQSNMHSEGPMDVGIACDCWTLFVSFLFIVVKPVQAGELRVRRSIDRIT